MIEASLRAIIDCSIPVCREHITSMLKAIVRDIRAWEQLMVTRMIVWWEIKEGEDGKSVHRLRGF